MGDYDKERDDLVLQLSEAFEGKNLFVIADVLATAIQMTAIMLKDIPDEEADEAIAHMGKALAEASISLSPDDRDVTH